MGMATTTPFDGNKQKFYYYDTGHWFHRNDVFYCADELPSFVSYYGVFGANGTGHGVSVTIAPGEATSSRKSCS